MNFFRILSITVILLVLVIFTWIKLPFEFKYQGKIKSGDVFANNLIKFKKENGFLPMPTDWKTLEKLSPLKPYNESKPQYDKLNGNHFILIFVEGFDPPYLFYDSRVKVWKYDFPPINKILEK